MTRFFYMAMAFVSVMLAQSLCGCAATPPPVTAYHPANLPAATTSPAPAVSDLEKIAKQGVKTVSDGTAKVIATATDCTAKVPSAKPWNDTQIATAKAIDSGVAALAPEWQAKLDTALNQIQANSTEIASLRQGAASNAAAIEAGNRATAEEHAARIKAEAALAKEKDDKAAKLEKSLFGVAIASLLGIGIAVTLGLLMHDIHISIAGAAGCMAVATGSFLLGEVIHYRFWILCTLGAVAAGAGIYAVMIYRDKLFPKVGTPVPAFGGGVK